MHDPENIEARKGISLCYIKRGNNEGAIEHLKKYVELRPKDIRYSLLLADALQREGKFADAVNVCLHCLELVNDKNIHNKLLKCMLGLPTDHQLQVLQALVDSGRATVDEYLRLAKLYIDRKDAGLAHSVLSGGIRIYVENHKLLSFLAKLALYECNFKEAYEINSRLVQYKPTNAVYRYHLYRAAYELGRYDEALQTIGALREEFPNDYRYILGEGLCLYQLEEYDNALQRLEDASLRMKESSWRVLYNIGIVATKLSDFEKAKMSLRRAIDLNPSAQEPRLFLANILYEEQKYSEAKELIINMFNIPKAQHGENIQQSSNDSDIPLVSFSHPPTSYRQTLANRAIRDTTLVKELKRMYDDTCQICGVRIIIGPGKYYSEVHHIRPLGGKHNGPDTLSNAIVLCPNHHTAFDYGCIAIHPSTHEIYEYQHGGVRKIGHLLLKPEHTISTECLTYYIENIFLGRLE
jgi:tetratricopeptide (TPR) repeat protein